VVELQFCDQDIVIIQRHGPFSDTSSRRTPYRSECSDISYQRRSFKAYSTSFSCI